MIRKAVIPAAGRGTRFLPATKSMPKEMLPILDKPSIQYVVEEAVDSGIEDILFITGRDKRAIEDHFDLSVELEAALRKSNKNETADSIRSIAEMVSVFYVRQKEAKGLGHAVGCARRHVGDEPFICLLGDDLLGDADKPATRMLMELYEKLTASIIVLVPVPPDQTHLYGIAGGEEVEPGVVRIDEMVEKPEPGSAPGNLAIVGRYLLTPEIFGEIENTEPGRGGEIQLTDALISLRRKQPIYGLVWQWGRWDIGTVPGFLRAQIEFALRREDLHSGVIESIREIMANLDKGEKR